MAESAQRPGESWTANNDAGLSVSSMAGSQLPSHIDLERQEMERLLQHLESLIDEAIEFASRSGATAARLSRYSERDRSTPGADGLSTTV